MIFGKKWYQQEQGWTKWYAWRPIQLEDGRMAWMHLIMRKRLFGETTWIWIYNLPPKR